MERVLVIVNPKSRRGEVDLAEALSRLRGAGWDVTVEYSQQGELGNSISSRCGDMERVVVAGGDGTMNLAAPALISCAHPVGLFPMGTANDLARTLHIPTNLRAAAEIIVNGRKHAIDLGCVNGVPFFNAAHIGLGAELTQRLSPLRKKRLGPLAYPRTLLSAFRHRRPFTAFVACDNECVRLRSLQITVGNGRFYGGGATVATQARIDDGELFLYSITPQKIWQMAALLPRLRRGTHGEHPRVLLLQGKEITVETQESMPITADGEIRARTPAHFSVLPRALEIFVPSDYPIPVTHAPF